MALSLFADAFSLFLGRYVSFEDLALLSLTLFAPSCSPEYRAEVWLRGVLASCTGAFSCFVGKLNYLEGRLTLPKGISRKITDDSGELRLVAA